MRSLMRSRKEYVSGAQHFLSTVEDGKLLLSGSQNFDELCAKLQMYLMKLRKNYLIKPIKPLDILCYSFVEQT